MNFFYDLISLLYEKLCSVKIMLLVRRFPKVPKAAGDIAFILCPGRSSDNISRKQFSEISNGFSVGINQWIFSDSMPNIFFFEPSSKVDLFEHQVEKIKEILKKPNIQIYLPHQALWSWRFFKKELCKEAQSRMNFYVAMPMGLNLGHLDTRLQNYISRSCKGSIFGTGSSVIRAISFLIKSGFGQVILIGLDFSEDYIRAVKNIEAFSGHRHNQAKKNSFKSLQNFIFYVSDRDNILKVKLFRHSVEDNCVNKVIPPWWP